MPESIWSKGKQALVRQKDKYIFLQFFRNNPVIIGNKAIRHFYRGIKLYALLDFLINIFYRFCIYYYGIVPEKLEEYIFVMSEEATSAETIVIMKVKDEADVESTLCRTKPFHQPAVAIIYRCCKKHQYNRTRN